MFLRFFFTSLLLLATGHLALAAARSDSCPTDSYRVRSTDRKAYYRGNGTFVRATHVESYCRSKSASYLFWSGKLNDDRPDNWPLKKEISTKWTDEQKERLYEAMAEVPNGLWSKSVKGIYRFLKSRDYPNPGSQYFSKIAIYDSAFDIEHRLTAVLAHELAHVLYDELPPAVTDSYENATGWTRTLHSGIIVYTGRKDGYVEKDGDFSPTEDFANNIEYYLFLPAILKSKTPTAFEWIKANLGDKILMRAK